MNPPDEKKEKITLLTAPAGVRCPSPVLGDSHVVIMYEFRAINDVYTLKFNITAI
jgi:hypothetical protein